MGGYSYLAKYYDLFTKNINYIKLSKVYISLLKKYKIKEGLIFDIACGTGNITFPLSKAGYDVTGIDSSPEMLSVAKEKATALNSDILFLNQDMRKLDLYGTYKAAVCALDGFNHLTRLSDLTRALKRIWLFLDPEGILIFDVNTPNKFEEDYSDRAYVYETEEVFCVWQNKYNKKTKICSFNLTFFEENNEDYARYEESFSEKAYSKEELKESLEQSGFILEEVLDDLDNNEEFKNPKRWFFVARKKYIVNSQK